VLEGLRQNGRMSLELIHVTVDCADAARLAGFWGQALGRQVDPRASAQFATIEGHGESPGWLFFQVPEGKAAKNRLHLDFRTDDLDAETRRLVELGAAVVHEKREWGAHWRTLTDPEGNEFCVQ
jgi:predicted enzyme related to lactoylglutathione lyase